MVIEMGVRMALHPRRRDLRGRESMHGCRITLLAFVLALVALAGAACPALAWKAGGHYVEAEKVRDLLPSHSVVKKAMLAYPAAAAWGSYGADLGYGGGSYADIARGYTPWTNKLHYHRVGTLATILLRRALAGGDLEQIAFAAGYLTHTTGDLAGHGLYVNPEAGGVFFDDAGTQSKHSELEKHAEPYIWKDLGGHDIADYIPGADAGTFLTGYLEGLHPPTERLFAQALQDVYGESPLADGFHAWIDTCFATMNNALTATVGGLYCGYAESATALDASQPNGETRRRNIDVAMERSVYNAQQLIVQAERGDYSGFVDTWNLDVGERPRTAIGEVTVRIHTADVWLAGTDDDVYLRLQLDGGGAYDKRLDTGAGGGLGYSDFEQNDDDWYFVYVGDPAFTPEHIAKVSIYKSSDGVAGGWRPDRFRIWVNGQQIVDEDPGHWFEDDDLWWGKDVGPLTWPTITGLGPASAKRGGLVTISGANLGAAQGAGTVRFGGAECARYVSWSATRIQCKVPATASYGKVSVTVTTTAGASNAMSFTVKR